MEDRIDIHNSAKRLLKAEAILHNPLNKKNIALILEFEKALFSEGLGKTRIAKYVMTMKALASRLGKGFDKATKKDIEGLVYEIERSDYSPWTKHDYKVALKKFYKWLKGNNEDYPECVKWIKTTIKRNDLLLPEQLLTEEEIMKLVDACSSIRDKAFIMSLYESGARIGELGCMRIKDVSFEESYAKLMLTGKTGSRRIIVVASTPYLMNWIQNHPLRRQQDAPLWINMGTVNQYKAMSYPALAKILRVAAKKAGLKKEVHPHKLRHSRATFLASRLKEAQMNEVFGWKQGSDMPSVYVHLSGRDVDDAILGVYGMKKVEDKKPELAPRICPRCNQSNVIDAKFCSRCGLALDVKVANEIEQARQKADGVMDVLVKDKEFRDLLMRKMKEYEIV
jgi:site-specific recombinase XerD/ribosomal protein L40E